MVTQVKDSILMLLRFSYFFAGRGTLIITDNFDEQISYLNCSHMPLQSNVTVQKLTEII